MNVHVNYITCKIPIVLFGMRVSSRHGIVFFSLFLLRFDRSLLEIAVDGQVYNELPVQYCVYDRLLNHSRPRGILRSTCQKYWSLQYFGATLHIRHTASNHRTSLVMSAKRSNCSSVARGSKKACLPNRSASQCKGNPINLASRNERRFPRKRPTGL